MFGRRKPEDVGHPTYQFQGYGVNPARYNGADVEPIPITPVRGQNWPGMQVQLSNGWMLTNYGLRMSYDSYLRMLSEKPSVAGRTMLTPGPTQKQFKGGMSPANFQQILDNGPGNQPQTGGGPGTLAPNVSLAGRAYYG